MTAKKTAEKTDTTADADEIARFTAIAAEWWDPKGKFRPLHQLAPVRMAFIRDQVMSHLGLDAESAEPFKGLDILDVGCGGGLVSEPLARLGANVTAIDAGDANVDIARHHAETLGLEIDYRHALAEDLLAEGRTFDIVVSLEVVEHVADLPMFLRCCAGLVRPGGGLALSTINRTVKSLAFAKIAAEYVLRWVPVGTHDWKKFVKPSELAAALRPAGLDIVGLEGMGYDPVGDTWRASRNLDMNYLAYAVKR